MFDYLKLILSTFLLITFSIGCDSSGFVQNEISMNDEFADITFEEIPEFQNIDENTIRNTYIKEVKEKLAEIEGYDKLKSALTSLDVRNSARLLRFKLPANAEVLETGEIKQFLKAYSRLITVKYCVETRVFFNHDLLHMPFGNYDLTYEQFVYWRWENCLSSDDVFVSSKLDYSPFSENELSVLYWSNKLLNFNNDKYRELVAKKLYRMRIFEKAGNTYNVSQYWLDKIKLDQTQYHDSKVGVKYKIPDPDYMTYWIQSIVNRTEFDHYGCGCGPGGGGGGFRYRKLRRKPIIISCDLRPEQPEIPRDVLIKFKNENLLNLLEIKELLKSNHFENQFRGTVHLFRYMQEKKDYKEIELLVELIELKSPQLVRIIKREVQSALKNADSKSKKHIKNFIYVLFEKVKPNRSEFLDLALSLADKEYLDKFVNLMADYKIFKIENQRKIIDFIVKNKKTEYIPKLFDWRFNCEDEDDFTLIKTEDFFKIMINFKRPDSLLKISSLLQTPTKEQSDKVKLGNLFLVETTGIDRNEYYIKKRRVKHAVDAKKLEASKMYFESAHLFTNTKLKNDFYAIVSENCDISVDQIVYNWFKNELNKDSQQILLKGFAVNTLNFTFSDYGSLSYIDPDEEKDDLDAKKREIRYQEKRFITLASYVLMYKQTHTLYTLFTIAPYLNSTDAWRIIKHFFDLNKTDEDLYSYFNKIDRLTKDPLGLIEVDKLKRYLYIYIIDYITSYNTATALIDAIKILAD